MLHAKALTPLFGVWCGGAHWIQCVDGLKIWQCGRQIIPLTDVLAVLWFQLPGQGFPTLSLHENMGLLWAQNHLQMTLHKAMLLLSSVCCVYSYWQLLAMILLSVFPKQGKKNNGQILAKAFGKKLPLSHAFVSTVFPKYWSINVLILRNQIFIFDGTLPV